MVDFVRCRRFLVHSHKACKTTVDCFIQLSVWLASNFSNLDKQLLLNFAQLVGDTFVFRAEL